MLHLAKCQAGEVHNVLSKTQEINVSDLFMAILDEYLPSGGVLETSRFSAVGGLVSF